MGGQGGRPLGNVVAVLRDRECIGTDLWGLGGCVGVECEIKIVEGY